MDSYKIFTGKEEQCTTEEKLKSRYPDGFSKDRSVNREENNERIKSRAWLKREKIMVRVMEINFPEHYITAHDERGEFYSKRGLGCVIMMQFTGLKDRNGKEIYEGDIVLTADGNVVATIKIGECCPSPVKKFCEFHGIKNHKIHCLHAYDKDGEYLIEDNKSLEIIGNIYENPDLMEEINNE